MQIVNTFSESRELGLLKYSFRQCVLFFDCSNFSVCISPRISGVIVFQFTMNARWTGSDCIVSHKFLNHQLTLAKILVSQGLSQLSVSPNSGTERAFYDVIT